MHISFTLLPGEGWFSICDMGSDTAVRRREAISKKIILSFEFHCNGTLIFSAYFIKLRSNCKLMVLLEIVSKEWKEELIEWV